MTPIFFISGTRPVDPEPEDCEPQSWLHPDEFDSGIGGLFFDSITYHPGATYNIRSELNTLSEGHQATYNAQGEVILNGIAAGSADRGPPNSRTHVMMDVLPFIWAAQLDGNPVEPSPLESVPAQLDQPLLYLGNRLKSYFIPRPAVANNKTQLLPSNCYVRGGYE